MARYTVRLNELVNYYSRVNEESLSGYSYSQKIDFCSHLIMPENYPCYGVDIEEEEVMRESLSRAIVRHYLMREIGYETFELWKIMMETRLREIMPYYQQLYQTTLFEIDLENPYHLITEHDETGKDTRNINRSGDRNETGKQTATTSNSVQYGRTVDTSADQNVNVTENVKGTNSQDGSISHSDFPQASYGSGDYVSYAEQNENSGSDNKDTTGKTTQKTTGKESQSGTDTTTIDSDSGVENKALWSDTSKDINDQIMHYLHDVKGHTTNADILDAVAKWRDLILNINKLIIDDISDLFMRIY